MRVIEVDKQLEGYTLGSLADYVPAGIYGVDVLLFVTRAPKHPPSGQLRADHNDA